jgi:hypothetical protein
MYKNYLQIYSIGVINKIFYKSFLKEIFQKAWVVDKSIYGGHVDYTVYKSQNFRGEIIQ